MLIKVALDPIDDNLCNCKNIHKRDLPVYFLITKFQDWIINNKNINNIKNKSSCISLLIDNNLFIEQGRRNLIRAIINLLFRPSISNIRSDLVVVNFFMHPASYHINQKTNGTPLKLDVEHNWRSNVLLLKKLVIYVSITITTFCLINSDVEQQQHGITTLIF